MKLQGIRIQYLPMSFSIQESFKSFLSRKDKDISDLGLGRVVCRGSYSIGPHKSFHKSFYHSVIAEVLQLPTGRKQIF